jgi:putative transport protein
MVKLFTDNPLLLLFVIAGISYPLGRIKIKGSSLGVAAVLFVSLAVGALDPSLRLPDVIYTLGAVLFVYTLGLSSGPAFFASFRSKGLRNTFYIVGLLVFAAVLTLAAHAVLGLRPTLTAGMYAGSLTCTPALAGVLEFIKANAPATARDAMLNEPVVGYSIAYPMGVLVPILSILLVKRLWKVDYAAEAAGLQSLGATSRRLFTRTICVTRPEVAGEMVHELVQKYGWDVNFGRLKRDGQLVLATGETRLEAGDLVSVVGGLDDVDQVTACLGEASDEHLEMDRSELDFRRVFVSSPKVVGHALKDFNLEQQFGATVTRVRRGDIEMLAHGDTVLQLGDRIRVLARREDLDRVALFFGDSYRALSEIDILTFSLGITLGLLVGLIPIPLPGGVVFTLGFAGGPLVVALVLGMVERTGPLVWTLPYSANLTLRQIGLTMFLAGIGTRAGYAFVTTLAHGDGTVFLVAGVIITTITMLLALWIGHRLLKIPMSLLSGMLAGLQTQPAVLGFAVEQTNNELPNAGYATAFPLAVIVKIVLAQLLLVILRQ